MLDRTSANRTFAGLLGWSPTDFGADAIDDNFAAKVSSIQTALGVAPDGIAGPATYTKWIDAEIGRLRATRASSMNWLLDAGQLAVLAAKRAWLGRVIDPPSAGTAYATSRAFIDAAIRTPSGLRWDWQAPYEKVNDFEWCGAFAAFAWSAAGLAMAWRRDFFSSTYRLDLWARYLPFEKTPNPKPTGTDLRRWRAFDEHSRAEDAVFPDSELPRAGDILLIGPAKSDYGAHVTLVETFDRASGTFTTVEGNGIGVWPTGEQVRGVVRAHHVIGTSSPNTYHPRRLVRPALRDLE